MLNLRKTWNSQKTIHFSNNIIIWWKQFILFAKNIMNIYEVIAECEFVLLLLYGFDTRVGAVGHFS